MHWAMTELEKGGDAFYSQTIKEQTGRKLIRKIQYLDIGKTHS